jgi:hypothetical protein
MNKENPALFGKTRFLERQIDEFLDKTDEAAIHVERALTTLVDEGVTQRGEEKLRQLMELKQRCNQIRRSVVNTLYTEMLIPEFRGDVLSLLTNLHALVDLMANCHQEFMVQHGGSRGSEDTRRDVKELVAVVVRSVRAAVLAARSFFRDPAAVGDHVNEIRIHEAEADAIALRLKQAIFAGDLPLERKIHARDAVNLIDRVADMAEDISDELSIYAIKRVL